MNSVSKLRYIPLAFSVLLTMSLSGCGESTSGQSGSAFDDGNNNGGDSGGDNNGGDTSSFDEKAMIAGLVDQVITPTFTAFQSETASLYNDVKSYCEVEQTIDDSTTDFAARDARFDSAKQSWREAMTAWQQAELMLLGPLSANESALRNVIYSWPSKSLCGVDQDTAYFEDGVINQNSARPYDLKDRTFTRRGLLSLEHLLFNTSYTHNCSVENEALAGWNSRTEQSVRIARCQFATEVSKDLNENAQSLVSQWNAEDGYANELKNAGEAGNSFATPLKAVNAISDALFYLDKEVKDFKLGIPLGQFTNSCGMSVCSKDVENSISMHSLENLKANLMAFEKLFLGNEIGSEAQLGFDDFLIESNAEDTRNLMVSGINDAKAATNAIETSLYDALNNDSDKVETTHAKVKDVTDQLKNDFINKLALELPKTSAGDND
ncbi:imelysin family protein [Pseudoalteromonas sp. MMG012]|uniref:imelysin family protein n=1 Tax=Pseudoalteromonas sp. MMG012 TaxID=2822686 RepID=UPI001B39E725|nr:imelysin family protein [Pseudoalteromonas sp. MMG012]MBQ4850960.1 imelysin family protein [Pseudoalteromonas sp. MMG012]